MIIYFLLVEPAVPENIGAAARAINTMGFKELRLIRPANHLADEAKWLAHGSTDVLENAKVYHSFTDAISDLDFVIATTAKKRSTKYDYYSPEKAKILAEKKGKSVSKIGIAFGREESGLTNKEIQACDLASTIPLEKPYPSINLAQSVMIYAYIFSSALNDEATISRDSDNYRGIYLEMKKKAEHIFSKLQIDKESNLYNRMLERIATCGDDDIRLFLSFAKKFDKKFE